MSKYYLKRNYEFTPINGLQLLAFSILSIFIGTSAIMLASNKNIYLKKINVLAESVVNTNQIPDTQKILESKEVKAEDLEYKENCFYDCNNEEFVKLINIYWKNIRSYKYSGIDLNSTENKTSSGKVDNKYSQRSETEKYEEKNVNEKIYSNGEINYSISQYINDNNDIKKYYEISNDDFPLNNPLLWMKKILIRNRITQQEGIYSYTLSSKYEYLDDIPTRVITKTEYLLVQNQIIGLARNKGKETVWVNYDGSLTNEKSAYGTYTIWIDSLGNPLKLAVLSYDSLCSETYTFSDFNINNKLDQEFELIAEDVKNYASKHPEILESIEPKE